VAAEVAAARPDVRGPGTFRAALLDELYNLTPEKMKEMVQMELQ
jgi:thiamine-phosphate diphosphorylase/hydroxyethylthiazole kinase